MLVGDNGNFHTVFLARAGHEGLAPIAKTYNPPMPIIEKLTALEILDSRGRPTVGVCCKLKEGASAWASVPSGASTGRAEAMELRDGDPARYGGLGCRRAVANIHGPIQAALAGRDFSTQRELDETMLSLDGTPNKSRLGANAILAVSIAFARAFAVAEGIPLYQHFAHLLGSSPTPPAPDRQPLQRRQARRRAGADPGRARRAAERHDDR